MENKKKPFYKRWWVWVIIIVVVPLAIDIIANPVPPQKQTGPVISEEQENSLSEVERKEVFKIILASERRAQEEADAVISPENMSENIDKFRELQSKYASEIRTRYDIDTDTYTNIIVEGANKGWTQEYYQEQGLSQ